MVRRSYILIALVAVVIAGSLLIGRREPATSGAAQQAVEPRPDTMVVPGVPDEVTQFLRNGQSWRAARALRREIAEGDLDSPEAVLLAARAEAGWGGWGQVRRYLEGKPWLDTVRNGEGWYWLGRSLEEDEEWEPAMAAYSRFLARSPRTAAGDRRRVAELRQGLILLRLGRVEEGAALLARTREHAPEVAPRVQILAAEALAERGDTAGVRRLVADAPEGELARRGRTALLDAYVDAGDPAAAIALARSYRDRAPGEAERALHGVRLARLSAAAGDAASAREVLRSIVRGAPGAPAARTAAELLGAMDGLSLDERLAIARVLDRHGDNRGAARHYRAWLAASGGSAADRASVRLATGRALFDAGDFPGAVTMLAPLNTASGAVGAEAMLLTGRAEARRGNQARSRQTFLSLAARHPRTAQGAEGLFLVADLAHDAGDASTARALYRRVTGEFPGTDRAGLALMRLAGMAYARGEFAAAAEAWEGYRSSYPTGDRWLESTYWSARARERAGDREGAAARYRAVRERLPISYYALRSAARQSEEFWPVALAADPPEDPAARARAEAWMHGVDLLAQAGLHQEAEAEIDRLIEQAAEDDAVLYALAETLNERGYTVRGTRIGTRLQARGGTPSARLLRIIYPFPYRAMIEAEAREKRLDPYLVAALIRQESSFKARIASPVGARGLMQVMPETGAGLARAAGISGWDAELLYQPEINTHLGTRFLADQMRAFDGSLPLVFAAYNAGPNRIPRWRRFPEYADPELFTERIPYRETRDYVKILTRNIALYRGLYGE